MVCKTDGFVIKYVTELPLEILGKNKKKKKVSYRYCNRKRILEKEICGTPFNYFDRFFFTDKDIIEKVIQNDEEIIDCAKPVTFYLLIKSYDCLNNATCFYFF